MREVAEAFVLGFVLGVSALVVVGSEIAKELRSVKTELAGTLERLAQAVENREPKSCVASSPGYRTVIQAGGSARQDLADLELTTES